MPLDVFHSDAFGLVSMTEALDKLPYIPKRLGQLGLFKEEGITTTVAMMEERQGKISLVQTAARGTMPRVQSTEKRQARAFPTLYLPEHDTVQADEVQGIRRFGSEDDTDGAAAVVNNKLQRLKNNIEATHEWHRVGALLGITYDADGTTQLFDWYSEFGITQQQVAFDFSSSSLDVAEHAFAVKQLIEDALGGDTYTSIRAICGNQFFKDLISHASVKNSFSNWQQGVGGALESVFTLQDPFKKRAGFPFGGITWEGYRGYVGSTPFIPTRECRFFPEGTSNFHATFSPAPFNETVNTVGRPMYAKQEPMKFDMGTEILVVSCPLFWCSRPGMIIRGIATGDVAGYYNMPSGPLQ